MSPAGALSGPPSFVLSQLQRDLHRIGPSLRRNLRKELTGIGRPLLADARRRAGWSSRIPAAISVRPVTNLTSGAVGIELRVAVTAAAPHARAYEGMGQGGTFRAPLWGNREHWYPHDTRPYAWPALLAARADAERAAQEAFDAACRAAGFR